MKKIFALVLVFTLVFALTACGGGEEGGAEAGGTVTVTVTDAAGAPIDVEFPANPERVVVLNHQTMDFLDAMGMGDKVVGYMKDGTVPEHLQKYVDDENIVNVGGMKDPDMEAIMSLEPDVIFISDRTEGQYDEFAAIAPTMAAYIDYSAGFMTGFKALASKHAQIFGVEGELDDVMAGYDERIAAIKEKADGQTALLGIFAGGLNTLGNEGRCAIIFNDMGFTNLLADKNVNHGDISSYEAWLELNPEWMFVLDKDTAVGKEAVAAKEQMDNVIIKETKAFKNNQIVYLEPGSVWYVADGGITSMDIMIKNIEKGIGIK